MGADKIIEMAKAGVSSAEIAKVVGVSRQRVYQVLKRSGVEPARPYGFHAGSGTRLAPRSRVITGGVEATLSTNIAGTICELLVAADLAARGWAVYLPLLRSKYHDLIALKDGRIATFEVRSGRRYPNGTLSYATDKTRRSDYYAVAVRGEPIVFEPSL